VPARYAGASRYAGGIAGGERKIIGIAAAEGLHPVSGLFAHGGEPTVGRARHAIHVRGRRRRRTFAVALHHCAFYQPGTRAGGGGGARCTPGRHRGRVQWDGAASPWQLTHSHTRRPAHAPAREQPGQPRMRYHTQMYGSTTRVMGVPGGSWQANRKQERGLGGGGGWRSHHCPFLSQDWLPRGPVKGFSGCALGLPLLPRLYDNFVYELQAGACGARAFCVALRVSIRL
jgi:hypothetical protein